MSKQAIKSLNLQISEAARQLRAARTLAEAKCLQETIDACRARLARG